jgi:hypothetical protein
MPVEDPTVKVPKIYLVSISWSSSFSAARTAIVAGSITAVVAVKMTKRF